jgi:hypothetical protein
MEEDLNKSPAAQSPTAESSAAESLVTESPTAETPEGLDTPSSFGWGEYPLDSVFVRSEQRTVNEVVRRIRADRYDLSPDFQRTFVWSIVKQSRLIESCLMRLPLPVFYVAEGSDGRIIVVDGLQRLNTFLRFLDNSFKLRFDRANEDGKNENPLQGKRFKDLQLTLQERIEDTQLTLYILDANAPAQAKFDIFERVNSGEPLTRQQMRNCLYNGPATRWLREAVDDAAFKKATGGSLNSKEMRDREAINRFCAFRLLGSENYPAGNMDGFLADALTQMNQSSEDELATLRHAFVQSMENNYELFREHAFRKSLVQESPHGRSVMNIALFDVCSVHLARFNNAQISQYGPQLKQAVRTLITDNPSFVQAITYSTNSRNQVRDRFSMMGDAVEEAIQ